MKKIIALVLCLFCMTSLQAVTKSRKIVKKQLLKAGEKLQTLYIYREHQNHPLRFYFHMGRYEALRQVDQLLLERQQRKKKWKVRRQRH